jgi:hypothetical protein
MAAAGAPLPRDAATQFTDAAGQLCRWAADALWDERGGSNVRSPTAAPPCSSAPSPGHLPLSERLTMRSRQRGLWAVLAAGLLALAPSWWLLDARFRRRAAEAEAAAAVQRAEREVPPGDMTLAELRRCALRLGRPTGPATGLTHEACCAGTMADWWRCRPAPVAPGRWCRARCWYRSAGGCTTSSGAGSTTRRASGATGPPYAPGPLTGRWAVE